VGKYEILTPNSNYQSENIHVIMKKSRKEMKYDKIRNTLRLLIKVLSLKGNLPSVHN